MAGLIAIRYRRGVVGETQRTCHFVQVGQESPGAEVFTALCDQQLAANLIEQLETFHGMPCPACLALATPAIADKAPVLGSQ